MKKSRIPTPRVDGDYVRVFRPGPGVYEGPATGSFASRTLYDEWIPNDFTVLRTGGELHLFGITHPRPRGFVDDFNFGPDVHEAEWQLFHCMAKGDPFREGAFQELPKILTPGERPGERPEIWAPHVTRWEGCYYMIYSPGEMRYAFSDDLLSWRPGGTLFVGESDDARDPFLFQDGSGKLLMLYVVRDRILCRESLDFFHWSAPWVFQESPWPGAAPESPFLLKRGGFYYLLWTVYDGRNGAYDNRTFVFASDALDGFRGLAPCAMLPAHAPEIVLDREGGTWLLSVRYPRNGVCAIRLIWEEQYA